MRRDRGRALVLAGILGAVSGCPTGYRFVTVQGERPAIDASYWDVVACAKNEIATSEEPGCVRARKPFFHCANLGPTAKKLCAISPFGRALAREPVGCDGFTSRVSFVHFSDAQLKDHNIWMEGAVSKETYDGLTNGALRHPMLERNDDAVLLGTMLAANELQAAPTLLAAAAAPCAPPARPSFAIHTGDAVDAGMFSELFQFLAVTQKLDMPLYQVIGNHDNLFFGTFPPGKMQGLNVVMPFVPIVDSDRFMRFHSIVGAQQDLSLPHSEMREGHTPTETGLWDSDDPETTTGLRPSEYHGFDLACDGGPTNAQLCTEARGYYAFDIPFGAGRRIRAIVLNTAEVVPTEVDQAFRNRSRGEVLPEQLRWLARQLETDPGGPDTYYLVFGHHDLEAFRYDEQGLAILERMLRRPRVLAYVTGHSHVDAFVSHPRTSGLPLVEIVAGSTLVYPQLARLVDLLEDPSGRVYVRVMSFRQQLGDVPEQIAKPHPSEPVGECAIASPDVSFCHWLARRAHDGRHGALMDHDADRRDEDDAVERANGLFLAFDPREKP